MKNKIIVIADDIRSSHNVGSLLRTCEGLGIEKVYLSGYTPYPISENDNRLPHLAKKITNKILKTSLGAEESIDWEHINNTSDAVKDLKAKGYQIIAVELTKNAVALSDLKIPSKVAFIFGNERTGISSEILKSVDKIICIPMLGRKESFNVVQSAAMVLYAARFID